MHSTSHQACCLRPQGGKDEHLAALLQSWWMLKSGIACACRARDTAASALRKTAGHAQRHQQPALGTDAWQSWLADRIRTEGFHPWQFGVTVEQLAAYQVSG